MVHNSQTSDKADFDFRHLLHIGQEHFGEHRHTAVVEALNVFAWLQPFAHADHYFLELLCIKRKVDVTRIGVKMSF